MVLVQLVIMYILFSNLIEETNAQVTNTQQESYPSIIAPIEGTEGEPVEFSNIDDNRPETESAVFLHSPSLDDILGYKSYLDLIILLINNE